MGVSMLGEGGGRGAVERDTRIEDGRGRGDEGQLLV
jgi:hypothetical protein